MSRQGTKVRNFATQVIDVDVALTEAEAATADVVSDFQSFEVNDRSEPAIGTINHIMVIDKDDKGILLDILFSDKQSAPVLGTNNDVVAISDADADTIIGRVSSGETYVDLVASKVVVPSAFSPIPFSTANGKLYVGVINRGAATTWTDAGGITIRLGLTIE